MGHQCCCHAARVPGAAPSLRYKPAHSRSVPFGFCRHKGLPVLRPSPQGTSVSPSAQMTQLTASTTLGFWLRAVAALALLSLRSHHVGTLGWSGALLPGKLGWEGSPGRCGRACRLAQAVLDPAGPGEARSGAHTQPGPSLHTVWSAEASEGQTPGAKGAGNVTAASQGKLLLSRTSAVAGAEN